MSFLDEMEKIANEELKEEALDEKWYQLQKSCPWKLNDYYCEGSNGGCCSMELCAPWQLISSLI